MKKGKIWITMGLLLISAALCLTAYNFWQTYKAGQSVKEALKQLEVLMEKNPIPVQGRIVSAKAENSVPGTADHSLNAENIIQNTNFDNDGADGIVDSSATNVAEGWIPSGMDASFIQPDEIEYPDYIVNPNVSMPVKIVDGQRYIGILSIPSLDLKLSVLKYWSYDLLKISPCCFQGSAYLDNFIICAHNYNTHFGHINELSIGDSVSFTDMDGNQFDYKVIEIEIVDPNAIRYMTTGDWDLTLFTCTLGGVSRVTVRCEKVSP